MVDVNIGINKQVYHADQNLTQLEADIKDRQGVYKFYNLYQEVDREVLFNRFLHNISQLQLMFADLTLSMNAKLYDLANSISTHWYMCFDDVLGMTKRLHEKDACKYALLLDVVKGVFTEMAEYYGKMAANNREKFLFVDGVKIKDMLKLMHENVTLIRNT